MINWSEVVEQGIYFMFSEHGISHISVSIAEGLEYLGISIFANQNYSPSYFKQGEFLFKKDNNISPNDCAICVVDINYDHIMFTGKQHPFFEQITDLREDLVVICVDMGDVYHPATMSYLTNSIFKGVLRTHTSSLIEHSPYCISWTFGLTNRIIKATKPNLDFCQRNKEMIAIFRSSLNQSVRIAMSFSFLSCLRNKIKIHENLIEENLTNQTDQNDFHSFYSSQSKTHHVSEWFKLLKETMFCCAYGGSFHCNNLFQSEYAGMDISTISVQPKRAIFRWDSWRFWESLAAGCVTIHLDFEQCGFLLPIKPINWQHYVGIDLTNPRATAERILDEPDLMAKIAYNGRQWTLENYSPLPVACRFLDIVLGEELGTIQTLINVL